ncbi:MAG: putative gyrase, subunit, partial [Pseudomonadota bacterium]
YLKDDRALEDYLIDQGLADVSLTALMADGSGAANATGAIRSGTALRGLVEQARLARGQIQALARKAGNRDVVEQAAIAGGLSTALLTNPELAATKAAEVADRLNRLEIMRLRASGDGLAGAVLGLPGGAGGEGTGGDDAGGEGVGGSAAASAAAPSAGGWSSMVLRDGTAPDAPVLGYAIVRLRRGVTHRHVLDADLLRSVEARRLDQMAADLADAYAAPARLAFRAKDLKLVTGPAGLMDGVLEQGRSGLQIQRYKGLGEMNPDQLWETTLDPTIRSLLQVKVNHADDAEDVFSTLMGDIVEPRRQFIQDNALKVSNLDV